MPISNDYKRSVLRQLLTDNLNRREQMQLLVRAFTDDYAAVDEPVDGKGSDGDTFICAADLDDMIMARFDEG